MHARDPHGILKKIFKLFLNQGGKFIQTNVTSLKQVNENETITFGYNRRIRRVRSYFINPFPSKSSATNIFQGFRPR